MRCVFTERVPISYACSSYPDFFSQEWLKYLISTNSRDNYETFSVLFAFWVQSYSICSGVLFLAFLNRAYSVRKRVQGKEWNSQQWIADFALECYAAKVHFREKRYKHLALLVLVSASLLFSRLTLPLPRNMVA